VHFMCERQSGMSVPCASCVEIDRASWSPCASSTEDWQPELAPLQLHPNNKNKKEPRK
jgi:hypothetical protein